MKTTRLAILAVVSSFAFGAAQADDADASQYGVQFNGSKSRAEVQAELSQYKQSRVNPWSTSYNPLASFRGQRTRAGVQAEYIASRDRVAAFTGEDSGSAYLAAHQPANATRQLAGTPANPQ